MKPEDIVRSGPNQYICKEGIAKELPGLLETFRIGWNLYIFSHLSENTSTGGASALRFFRLQEQLIKPLQSLCLFKTAEPQIIIGIKDAVMAITASLIPMMICGSAVLKRQRLWSGLMSCSWRRKKRSADAPPVDVFSDKWENIYKFQPILNVSSSPGSSFAIPSLHMY